MVPCENFILSEHKKSQPLQESFNNSNCYLQDLLLGHRYNKEDCTYSTKSKGKFADKSRRQGFGHKFQLEFAGLCVKIGPHFKRLKKYGVRIPECVVMTTVIRDHSEKQLDINDLHQSIMTVRSTLSSKKLSWVVSDGSPWDETGVRNELITFLDSVDTFCLRRNKKREQMEVIRKIPPVATSLVKTF